MSNHFTYEIDERNVRLQLKGHVLITKEDDWHKFDAMLLNANDDLNKPIAASKISISLNRNLLMPLVFGIIILAFASVLVNFISIKNQAKNNPNTVLSVQAAAIPVPNESTNQSTPQTSSNEIKQEPTPVVEKQDPVVERTKTETPQIASSAKITSSETTALQPALVNASPSNDTNLNASTVSTTSNTPEVNKKKRKKRLLESIESEQNSALRPTLVSEDRDSEVQPE